MFRVAIVGRPNVGKSTLFNKLTASRRSIVGDEPGITRDRVFEKAEWFGRRFEVIDTGGIVPDEKDLIPSEILRQAERAVGDSDLVLFVVDGRDGRTPIDDSLNSILRASGKEVFLVVNKVDSAMQDDRVLPFYALGIEQIFPISAEHSLGLDELIDALVGRIPPGPEQAEDQHPEEIRVAIIGRPNMGKSSILNCLVGEERAIVTDIPGTTRDAVDTLLVRQGRRYRLIDTAGIRRKGKTVQMADKLSVVMARRHIEECDIALLVIDPLEGATKTDATIGGYAHDAGKSLIIVVNKWDLVERDTHTASRLEGEYRMAFRFLDYAPLVFVSAKTGQRIFKLLEFVDQAAEARRQRVPTAELNRFVEQEVQPRFMSSGSASRKFPVLFMAQVGVSPPSFVIFTRSRRKVHFSMERFVINRLRERYGFYATPIRLIQRLRPPRKGS